MQEKRIDVQIDNLFRLEKVLTKLLEEKKYEDFNQKQRSLLKELKSFFENNPVDSIAVYSLQLKTLESNINKLEKTAKEKLQLLRNQSLLQKRNKNKLNAYK